MVLCTDRDDKNENGDALEKNFSLQTLYNFVHQMLRTTEKTKRILEMECEEAKFALKPWVIETTVIRQLDKNVCSCEEVLDNPDEIAEEIGKAVLHSQQLRKKLAMNLNKERHESRRPTFRDIYARKTSPPRASRPPLKESVANWPRQKPVRRSISQQRLVVEEQRRHHRSRSSFRSTDNEYARGGRKPRPSGRNQFSTSRDNSLVRLAALEKSRKSETNFILANKVNVGRANRFAEADKAPPKCQLQKTKDNKACKRIASTKTSEKLKFVRNDDMELLGDLDGLIKKFTTSTTMSSRTRENCPIHGKNTPSFIEEKILTSLDAVEGLDRVGVPSALVSILKIYHAFVRDEIFQAENPLVKKQKHAADNFLSNLEAINHKNYPPQLKKFEELLTGFSLLYNESFDLNFSKTQFNSLMSRFLNLDLLYDECNVKKQAGNLKFNKTNVQYDEFIPDVKNWISNGIWNYLCIPSIKGIFGSHCIRYTERNQLIEFFDFIQKFQRKTYEIELIEILMMTIIPKLKELFDPQSKEFIEIYKMIVTTVQTLNPRVPALAITESNE